MKISRLAAAVGAACLAGSALAQDVAEPKPSAAVGAPAALAQTEPETQAEAPPAPQAPSEGAAPDSAPAPEPAAVPEPPSASGDLVASTERPGPAVYVPMRAGSSAFALIGAFAEIAEGKDLSKKYDLQDPAPKIAVEVARLFASSKNASVAPAPIVVTTAKPEEIVAAAAGAKYVVDVASGGITSMYFSFDWAHYGVMYGAQLRIYEVATGATLVKGRCFIKPQKTPQSPTNDEMMADDAKVLKAMIAAAGDACVVELKEKVLKL